MRAKFGASGGLNGGVRMGGIGSDGAGAGGGGLGLSGGLSSVAPVLSTAKETASWLWGAAKAKVETVTTFDATGDLAHLKRDDSGGMGAGGKVYEGFGGFDISDSTPSPPQPPQPPQQQPHVAARQQPTPASAAATTSSTMGGAAPVVDVADGWGDDGWGDEAENGLGDDLDAELDAELDAALGPQARRQQRRRRQRRRRRRPPPSRQPSLSSQLPSSELTTGATMIIGDARQSILTPCARRCSIWVRTWGAGQLTQTLAARRKTIVNSRDGVVRVGDAKARCLSYRSSANGSVSAVLSSAGTTLRGKTVGHRKHACVSALGTRLTARRGSRRDRSRSRLTIDV